MVGSYAVVAALAALAAWQLARQWEPGYSTPTRADFPRRLAAHHHFLTDDPEFLDELYLRLLSPDEPINRRLYPLGTDGGVVSWILWDQ